jgi:hypothetical protein
MAAIIAGSTLYYTQTLVDKLQRKERQSAELLARSWAYLNTAEETSDLTFILENIIIPIDFPMIYTDADDKVDVRNESQIRNLKIDTALSLHEAEEFVRDEIRRMDANNPPIPIMAAINDKDTVILGKIHYGDSILIMQLQYYPYFQIAFATLFILIGYISFSYIKKNEQSNIWVGMSKETAHQLGTPISSLMGWSEILKMNSKDPDKVLDAVEELDNDIERLSIIAQRFSKIGSKPELKQKNIHEEISKIQKYFERRLPHTGKSVEIKVLGDVKACAMINSYLFDWVLENLIKNALDAIESKNGLIEFSIAETKRNIEIDVRDNGKGFDMKKKKDIFRPGYSTKRRGWGLGLSLSKRIIEEYHNGKIFVKRSIINEGTTFKIILKK